MHPTAARALSCVVRCRAVPVAVSLLGVAGLLAGLACPAHADALGDKSVLVAPFLFPKTGTVQRPPADSIREAYDQRFEDFWFDNSYGNFEVFTHTHGYVNLPWPKDAGGTTGPDLNRDGLRATGAGELFTEETDKYPESGADNPVIDGFYTPGERFADANGNGKYDVAEVWTDVLAMTPADGGNNVAGNNDGQWDARGERFVDLPDIVGNFNVTYDPSITLSIYDREWDIETDGVEDGAALVGTAKVMANRFVTVNEQFPIDALRAAYPVGGGGAITTEPDKWFQANSLINFNGDFQTRDHDEQLNPTEPWQAPNGEFDFGPNGDNPVYNATNQKIYFTRVKSLTEDEDTGDLTPEYEIVECIVYETVEPYTDSDNSGTWSDREAFEDGMVRYDAYGSGSGPGWIMVTEQDIRVNYPYLTTGDVLMCDVETFPGSGVYIYEVPGREHLNQHVYDGGDGWVDAAAGVSGTAGLAYANSFNALDPFWNGNAFGGDDIWFDVTHKDAETNVYDAGIDIQVYAGPDGWTAADGTAAGAWSKLLFYDANDDDQWTVGEDIWADGFLGRALVYDATDIQVFDGDDDSSNEFDLNDGEWTTPSGDAPGINTGLAYNDTNSSLQWDDGEDIWADRGIAMQYEAGTDTVLRSGAGAGLLLNGALADANDVLYWYDADGNLAYDSGELLWNDVGTQPGRFDIDDIVVFAPNTGNPGYGSRGYYAYMLPDMPGPLFYDANGDDRYTNDGASTEGIWVDRGLAGVYEAGLDVQVWDGGNGWETEADTVGSISELYYRDFNGNTQYDTGEDIFKSVLYDFGPTAPAGMPAGVPPEMVPFAPRYGPFPNSTLGNGISDNGDELWSRTGNGVYDGREGFTNVSNTKMAITGAASTFTMALNWDPHGWYGTPEQWWMDTFPRSTWPNLTGMPATPNIAAYTPGGRGGLGGDGHPTLIQSVGGVQGNIQPDAKGIWYDSAREYRDMPSSIYHISGDGRLGEQTDPESTSIAGVDKGGNNPVAFAPDDIVTMAGPMAFNIHGEHGYDAGNQLSCEILTWCTGYSLAGSMLGNCDAAVSSPNRDQGWVGADAGFKLCRDTNLDGLVDQGEAVDSGYNNYIAGSYPYDRVRAMEDVVEALDSYENFNRFGDEEGFPFIDYIAAIHPEGYPGDKMPAVSGLTYAILTADHERPLQGMGQVLDMGRSELDSGGPTPQFAMTTVAHEATHDWLGAPDLYDYDTWNGIITNNPIGGNDIMGTGDLVHYTPPLKMLGGWIEPRMLSGADAMVRPDTPQILNLYPIESEPNQYYRYVRAGDSEEYWMWYESGVTGNLDVKPGVRGVYLMHNDLGQDPNALPQQQRTNNHYTYEMVQADGRQDLQDATNSGDTGDPWPGETNNRKFNRVTNPASVWWDGTYTHLDVLDIVLPEAGDANSPAQVTVLWRWREVPELSFIDPPGGSSRFGTFDLTYAAWDDDGSTLINFYRDGDNDGLEDYDGTLLAADVTKLRGDMDDRLSDALPQVPGARVYRYYALLQPPTRDTIYTPFIPSTGGFGTALMTTPPVYAPGAAPADNPAAQTWTFKCITPGVDGVAQFTVTGSLSGQIGTATAGAPFQSGTGNYSGNFTVLITDDEPIVPFAVGDTFTFSVLPYSDTASSVLADPANRGDGSMGIATAPLVSSGAAATACSTLQSWTATCVVGGGDGVAQFTVAGSESGVIGTATAGQYFDSGATNSTGNFSLMIRTGNYDFESGDVFRFKTTGYTPYSDGLLVIDGNVPNEPHNEEIPILSDIDGDMIDDVWEYDHFGDMTTTSGGQDDYDLDGLTDYYEYLAGTDPTERDSDGDGREDDISDTDGDGLANIDEQDYGSDPGNPDTDDDGFPDGEEVRSTQPDPANNYGFARTMTAPGYAMSPEIPRSLTLSGNRLRPQAKVNDRYGFLPQEAATGGPVVTITAPQDGADIPERFTTLTGTVTSAIPLETVRLYINGLYAMDLDFGAFNATIIISSGQNVLEVRAIDTDGLEGSASVTVNGSFAAAAIRVTNNWDVPGDLDTWLVDPQGRHMGFTSSGPGYPDNTTAQIPGAELDIDDVSGTGPENITLESGSAIAGDYEVWINNYSHSNNPNSTVRVLVHEGEEGYQYVEFGPENMPTSDGNGNDENAWWHVTTVSWPSGTMDPPGEPVSEEQASTGGEEDTGSGARSFEGWTIESWMRPGDAAQTGALASYKLRNGGLIYEAGLVANRPILRVMGNSGEVFEAIGGPLPAGKWSHVAFVYSKDESTVRVHVNGIGQAGTRISEGRLTLAGELVLDTQLTTQPGFTFTNCQVDELRFWSRARNDVLLAENMHVRVDAGSSLVADFRFDDGGRTIEDMSNPLDPDYALANLPDTATNPKPGPDGHFGTADDIAYNPFGGPDGQNDYVTARYAAPVYGFEDSDSDGLPDWYEQFFFDGVVAPTNDFDGDGLWTLYEYYCNTNPRSPDTDGDGVLDAYEDYDLDGLLNINEQEQKCDPRRPDTDDDGVDDGAELLGFTDPAHPLLPRTERILTLDGTGYVDMANLPSFALSSWTLEAWVKPQAPVGAGGVIERGVSASTMNYWMGLDAAGLPVVAFSPASGAAMVTLIGDTPINAQWTHLAATFDDAGNLFSLYVNGELEATKIVSVAAATSGMGPVWTRLGTGFRGQLDEVRIWSTVRSHVDIRDTMDQALSGKETGLVSYFSFDDGPAVTRVADYAAVVALPESTPGVVHDQALGGYYINVGAAQAPAGNGWVLTQPPTVQEMVSRVPFQGWLNHWAYAGRIVGGASADLAAGNGPIRGTEVDSDDDGMPDWWETMYFGGPQPSNGFNDTDLDGVMDYYEFLAGLNPLLIDSDANGTPDGREDIDGDGLNVLAEQRHWSSPMLIDTDDDGLTDFEEATGQDDAVNTPAAAPNGRLTNPSDSLDPLTPRVLSLDAATQDYVAVPAQDRHVADSWTVEAWVNPAAAETDGAVLVRLLLPSGETNYELGLQAVGADLVPYASFSVNGVSYKAGGSETYAQAEHLWYPSGSNGTGLIRRGQWTYVAATMSTREHTLTVYVDGEAIARRVNLTAIPADDETGTGQLTLGGVPDSVAPDRFLTGLLDEVKVWDGARSADILARTYRTEISTGVEDTGTTPPASVAEALQRPHVPQRLLVKFRTGASASMQQSVHASLGAGVKYTSSLCGVQVVEIPEDGNLAEVMTEYRKHPAVAYAEPDALRQLSRLPSDSSLSQQWGLHNTGQQGGTVGIDIRANLAWDVTTGSRDVVVAVIDTGVDYEHTDLAANMWVNHDEIPNNEIDDDGNGYVDDVVGYNFAEGNADPSDAHGHGTHCAGIIGAVGNNDHGVCGVNWNVKIMACKVGTGSGLAVSAVIEALDYAVSNGAMISNNSYGGFGFLQAEYDAFRAARDAGHLAVVAAGNDGAEIDGYADYMPVSPAQFELDNILTVAAIDRYGNLAGFSNYGRETVDIAAPGVDIYSTLPGVFPYTADATYGDMSGTSMACPFVAGAAALLKSVHPEWEAPALKQAILDGARPLPSLAGRVATNGMLDLDGALEAGGKGMVLYTRFDDGGATVEDFSVRQDWLNGWKHAATLVNGAQRIDGSVVTRRDSDGDGMPDYWEQANGLDPTTDDATDDADADGLTNLYEYLAGTNPHEPDSDQNGVNDDLDDTDGDGLSNIVEQEYGTDPGDPDTDDDGFTDGQEIRHDLPTLADDYGVREQMTSPRHAESPRIPRSLVLNGNALEAPMPAAEMVGFAPPVEPDEPEVEPDGPVVTITAPLAGTLVADRFATITGTVTSTAELASTQLFINDLFVADLTLVNGSFAEVVIISAGSNVVLVRATDVDGLEGEDTTTVIGTAPPAAIRVTNTWDTNGDLDTWLVDPQGRHMGFSSAGPGYPNSGSGQIPGADLDIDDVSGTGPENITVPRGYTVDGDYEVWINNYSHGNNPNSTVRVLLNEGEDDYRIVEFGPQAIPTSDGNGNNPEAWWHVTTIDWPSGTMDPPGSTIGGVDDGGTGDDDDDGDDTPTEPEPDIDPLRDPRSFEGWTIEAWLRPGDAAQTGALISYRQGNGAVLYEAGLRANRPVLRVAGMDSQVYEVVAGPLPPNLWSHVAWVYSIEEDAIRIHVNGLGYVATQMAVDRLELQGSLTLDTRLSTDAGLTFTNCHADELRFWNLAHNDVLIAQNMYRNVIGSANLVAAYSFDDGGAMIADAVRPLDEDYAIKGLPDTATNAKPGPDGIFGSADDIAFAPGAGPDGQNDLVTATHAATSYGDVDTDGDGMPDWWEIFFFDGQVTANDDFDEDGLNAVSEYRSGTNPRSPDTDGDGVLDPYEDRDGDGLLNINEQDQKSDPRVVDTDDDGIDDGTEVANYSRPANPLLPMADRVLSLDGTGYVHMPQRSTFALRTWTVEAWIKPEPPLANSGIIQRYVGEGPSGGLFNYVLGIDAGGRPVVALSPGDNSDMIVLTADTSARARWTHVAASFSDRDNTLSLYVDGRLVATRYVSKSCTISGSGPVHTRIGNGFRGQIDEVRIWRSVRTRDELIAARSAPLDGSEGGLVSYLRFDDGPSLVQVADYAAVTALSPDIGAVALDRNLGAYYVNTGPTATPNNGWVPTQAPSVQEFVAAVPLEDWHNDWAHAGRLMGGASADPAPIDAPVLGAVVDSDGDGLPDWWEIQFFTTIDAYDGTDDPDFDDYTNAEEYRHGTHPLFADVKPNQAPVWPTGQTVAIYPNSTWPANGGLVARDAVLEAIVLLPAADSDVGDSVYYEYQWYVDGETLALATGNTLDLADYALVGGEVIRVDVLPYDNLAAYGLASTADVVTTVSASLPMPEVVSFTPLEPQEGGELSVTLTSPHSIRVRWYRNHEFVTEQDAISGQPAVLGEELLGGDVWYFKAYSYDGGGGVSRWYSSLTDIAVGSRRVQIPAEDPDDLPGQLSGRGVAYINPEYPTLEDMLQCNASGINSVEPFGYFFEWFMRVSGSTDFLPLGVYSPLIDLTEIELSDEARASRATAHLDDNTQEFVLLMINQANVYWEVREDELWIRLSYPTARLINYPGTDGGVVAVVTDDIQVPADVMGEGDVTVVQEVFDPNPLDDDVPDADDPDAVVVRYAVVPFNIEELEDVSSGDSFLCRVYAMDVYGNMTAPFQTEPVVIIGSLLEPESGGQTGTETGTQNDDDDDNNNNNNNNNNNDNNNDNDNDNDTTTGTTTGGGTGSSSGGSIVDNSAYEPNDTRAEARRILPKLDWYDADSPNVQHHYMEEQDSDWFWFYVPFDDGYGRARVIVETNAGEQMFTPLHNSENDTADTRLELYDGTGRRLAIRDDVGGLGMEGSTLYGRYDGILTPGLYYVHITSVLDLEFEYAIHLRIDVTSGYLPPTAPLSVMLTTSTGNMDATEDLICTASGATSSLGEAAITYRYVWTRDGRIMPLGGNDTSLYGAANYELMHSTTTNVLSAEYTQPGDQWECRVYAIDANGMSSGTASNTLVLPGTGASGSGDTINWGMTLSATTVINGVVDPVTTSVSIGWTPNATHGFDLNLDSEISTVPGIPGEIATMPAGSIYSIGTENPHLALANDLRPSGSYGSSWYIKVDFSSAASSCRLSWLPSMAAQLPRPIYLTEVNSMGDFSPLGSTSVDMTEASELVIRPNRESSKTFRVGFEGGTATQSIDLVHGWNLVSLYVEPITAEPGEVFRDSRGSVKHGPVWEFRDGVYQSTDEMTVRRGYWVYCSREQGATVTVSGQMATGNLAVLAGWNLVGFLRDMDSPNHAALESLFGFHGGSYVDRTYRAGLTPQNQVRRGHGYWLFATQDADDIPAE